MDTNTETDLDTEMDPETRLEADLRNRLAETRSDERADELCHRLLEKDTVNEYLIGLQDDCTRALFYNTATRSITNEPLEESDSDSAPTEHIPNITNRNRLRAWIVDREWSWIHPRYRWIVTRGPSENSTRIRSYRTQNR
ncbi:hypothetical protein [Natronoglomus mannanivorans]|uniref:Uncharacterized protein n=1 Tax=Natronoglomus mannanivorans TaxID=2979990 RepID=A0AAP2YY49_9EURY|nr:hypothetical protein [Halobacteria archaeon AArc-xg1-1]